MVIHGYLLLFKVFVCIGCIGYICDRVFYSIHVKGYLWIGLTGIVFLMLCLEKRASSQEMITPGQSGVLEKEDFGFQKDFSVPVRKINDLPFKQPWVGGLNACQVSEVDLDLDGIMDMVVFDRHGNRLLPFLNDGSSHQNAFTYAYKYQKLFPEVQEWMNLVDYNGDGKNDLFTYTTGGIRVYRNHSDTCLNFVLEKPILTSYYYNGYVNLFALPVDYPVFADVDLDGDMDVLNFFTLGKYVNFHKNLSIEKYGIPDSLDFRLAELCWGFFEESELSNVLTLQINCNERVELQTLQRHSGSTLLALDMDADQDKDLLVGDIDYATIIGLTNGGTPSAALMTGQDTAFPAGDVPVGLMSMPVCSFLDTDNDQVRELLVSPFDPGLDRTENVESVWRYENSGTDDVPLFHLERKDFLQEEMIDLGAGAYPLITDIDGDGLEDLVVGNFGYLDSAYYALGYLYLVYRSQIALFINDGTVGMPSFRLMDTDFGNLSSLMLQGAYPALADLDQDGDIDMLAGNSDGTILFLENQAGPGVVPLFASPVMNYQGIDVGEFSTPQLFDLDKDGLCDLIIGKRDGTLSYYRNTGSVAVPVFTLIADHLGGVDVTDNNLSLDGFSTPCFFETEGHLRLFAGSEFGQIYYYRDIDDNLEGTFTLVDDHYLYLDEGSRTGFSIWNFDNDAYVDLIIGNYSGGLAMYKGVTPHEVGMDEPASGIPRVNIFPNPSRDRVFVEAGTSLRKEMLEISVTDLLGRNIHEERMLPEKILSVDISQLPTGIYLITVRNGKGFMKTHKLLKY